MCTPRVNNCIGAEHKIISLYQAEDSHVGAFADYSNKICCSINVCPANFEWNEQSQTCQLIPQACLKWTGNQGTGPESGPDPTYACQELWAEPISQTGSYWNDALTPLVQDCFADFASPGDNGRACCYIAEYPEGTTWGSYETNAIIKEPISEILAD